MFQFGLLSGWSVFWVDFKQNIRVLDELYKTSEGFNDCCIAQCSYFFLSRLLHVFFYICIYIYDTMNILNNKIIFRITWTKNSHFHEDCPLFSLLNTKVNCRINIRKTGRQPIKFWIIHGICMYKNIKMRKRSNFIYVSLTFCCVPKLYDDKYELIFFFQTCASL